MNTREPVCDVWASPPSFLSEAKTGKIRSVRKITRQRNLRKPAIKAYRSAFLRELLPLLSQCPEPVM